MKLTLGSELPQPIKRLIVCPVAAGIPLGNCPKCGKNFGAHEFVGRTSPLVVGDVVLCVGCGTPLVIVALPYEMRAMTSTELANLDARQIDFIVRGRQKILRASGSVAGSGYR